VATRSRSFERAAPFYDQTRGLPGPAVAEVTRLLVAELTGRGRGLEIGVGTGRVALPLHQAGVEMVGVDLARAMMAVLIEKAGGAMPFPLAQADATALPFPTDSFGAGLASHVFHLIPGWREALHELVRVVRPGGVVLSSRGGSAGGSVLRAVRTRFRQEVGSRAGHLGAEHGSDEVERELRELGARGRSLPVVHASRTTTIATLIDGLEAGHWSWTWDVAPAVLRDAATRTRTWAETERGPLDAPAVVDTEVRWRAFDLP
jgi:ubiquinone/menaquinone biosynthesis C-methylase UbiE